MRKRTDFPVLPDWLAVRQRVMQWVATLVLHYLRMRPKVRLLVDVSRRLSILNKTIANRVSFGLTMVAGHPKTSGTLVVSEVFSLPISQILCMQPNPLSPREPAMEVELSWRDLLYFEGTRRTKAFYYLRDTISYSEVVAGLAGTSDLRDYLNRITRFGTEWAKDRELRTQYLIDQFRADPSSLVDSPMIVDILSNGTIVLQDGHHRASLLSLAGHDRLLCRLRA